MARDMFDPVTGEKLDDPVAKSFDVSFEAEGKERSTVVNTLSEEADDEFFEERLAEERRDQPDELEVVESELIDTTRRGEDATLRKDL